MTGFGVNARMYALTPAAAESWSQLFDWVGRRAGLPLAPVAHPPPLPLDTLWARRDLAAVFVCGYPFATMRPQPALVAAPIPDDADHGGRALYWSDIVCRADAPFRRLDDAFGARFGWTVRHSQSGFNAPRHLFAPYAATRDGRLFGQVVGDLVTPRRVIEAVLSGEIDLGPLDSYCHAILRRHEPGLMAGLRVLARTASAPTPPLVATQNLEPTALDALRRAFGEVGAAAELADVRRELCLLGFDLPDASDYETQLRMAREAEAMGYADIR